MPAQTAKKTAARRTSDKPAPVGFNFDTYHRDELIEPFVVVLDGQRYESLDPLDVDFRAILRVLTDPVELFRVLFPDDAEEILGKQIPLGALATFSNAIEAHFGLEDFAAALS